MDNSIMTGVACVVRMVQSTEPKCCESRKENKSEKEEREDIE